jgi:hypothetical protein
MCLFSRSPLKKAIIFRIKREDWGDFISKTGENQQKLVKITKNFTKIQKMLKSANRLHEVPGLLDGGRKKPSHYACLLLANAG